MANELLNLENDTCFTRQKSEIVSARKKRDGLHVYPKELVTREMTFDDLFLERFVPLDSRKKVGNYVLGKVIGEGAFSKVRIGKHVDTGEKMAVKIIPKKTIQHQQEAYRRFMRETRNLRQLCHKNIVRLHEVMETRANYYLVMEVLDGQNLKTYIQKRRMLSEEQSRPFVRQLTVAVQYMHSLNIAHRDLKPDNCMVVRDRVIIFDFGLSASIQEGDVMRTQCGSPAYAAPEIFNHEPYTKLVDIWSLGVILFLMLTGCLPYNCTGRSSAHLYSVIMKGYTIPHTVTLSTDCTDLISQVLQTDPSLRLSATKLLEHPWLHQS